MPRLCAKDIRLARPWLYQ